MLRPMLFIGVGGAGGKTLRVIRYELQQSLIKAGYVGHFPEAWQFLHFDITRDGAGFPYPVLDTESHHVVIPQGANFKDMQSSIESGHSKEELRQLLSGWATPVPRVEYNGNLRIHRGIGRQVAIPNLKLISDEVQKSIDKMKSPGASSELEDIGKLLGFPTTLSSPHAFLFSSLGGTAGSGMLIDIIEILKRSTNDSWANYLTAFLYTPEVFESLSGHSRDISKNTFGAFNELIANRSNQVTPQTEDLYSKLGLRSDIYIGKKTFEHSVNFLIGTKNSQGVDIQFGPRYAGIDEVFREIGGSLANVFVDPSTSEWFFKQQVHLSWPQSAPTDLSGLTSLHPVNGKPTCLAAGIGFMKLSTGTEQFLEYLADAITREQVEILLWPTLDSSLLSSGTHAKEIVDSAADERWIEFLTNSGVHEQDAGPQITERLLPDGWQEKISNNVSELIDRQISDNPIEIDFFGRQLWDEWERESKTLLKDMKTIIDSNFEKWFIDLQVHLQNQIAESLAKDGYAVTQNLLNRLEIELREFVLPVLKRDSKEYATATGVFNYQTFTADLHDWSNRLTHVSGRKTELLYKIQSSLEKVISFQVLSHAKEVGTFAVENMLASIFIPLGKLLSDKHFELGHMMRDSTWFSGVENMYKDFPKWGSGVVPKQYGPRRTEVTLLETSDYESVFAKYSIDSTGKDVSFPTLVMQSLIGHIAENKSRGIKQQSLITSDIRLVHSAQDLYARKANKNAEINWQIATNIDELRIRNRIFIRDSSGALSDFIKCSIHSFVADSKIDPGQRVIREQKFVQKFSEQLRNAEPFISLNENAVDRYLKRVDGNEPVGKLAYKYSKIPFSPKSDVGKQCVEMLKLQGYDTLGTSFENEWFDQGSIAQSIMAISTNHEALPLWAFSSMTDPLLYAATRNSADGMSRWSDFSWGLRSRPFNEYIPLQAEVRNSIITGWFIARAFDLFKESTDAYSSRVKLLIFEESEHQWNSFPDPLIDTQKSGGMLTRVLSSLGLAICDFGQKGDRAPIAGYLTLKRIGREVTTTLKDRDSWDSLGIGDLVSSGSATQSELLRKWIAEGQLPSETVSISPKIQKLIDAGKSRSEALDSYFSSVQEKYSVRWNALKDAPWVELPENWEIREDINRALSDIREYVAIVSRDDGSLDS